MEKKTNYTKEELLNKEFSVAVKGYNPLEVDQVLDKIIEDYERFEKNKSNSSVDVEELLSQIKALKEENETIKEELEKERNKWKYISKDHKDIHLDNYELLLRIGKLEMYIHDKLGINPEDIK